MANVFIPAGIRDKAIRDTLIAIVRQLGNPTNANVQISAEPPNTYDAGTVGDIIYASSDSSIWIFDGTVWAQGPSGPSGDDGLTTLIEVSNGNVFKNNAGNVKTIKATLFIGGNESTNTAHAGYNYKWTTGGNTVCIASDRSVVDLNGAPLTSSNGTTCTTGVVADSSVTTSLGSSIREIKVGAEDILTSTEFTCEISNIP